MTRRTFLFGALVALPALPGKRGLAGWYGHGDGFHGKMTASGEVFHKDRLTAAHTELPFGTRVQVRNLKNNRRVDVRITDRLPDVKVNEGRILDVSYGAARKLRMVEAGVVPVEIIIRGG